jgi:hypothetical protein
MVCRLFSVVNLAAFGLFAVLVLGLAACGGPPSLPATPTVTAVLPTATVALPTATAQDLATPSPEEPVVAPTETTGGPEAAPSPTEGAASGDGRVIYLDRDGETVRSVRPDGSDGQTLFKIDRLADHIVSGLSADPTGAVLLYGLAKQPYETWPVYYRVVGGSAVEMGSFAGVPRWSPDSSRFVVQAVNADGAPGRIVVYSGGGETADPLTAEGRADWFPSSDRLVYVYMDNVYAYDLQSRRSVQLTRLPNDEMNAWVVQEAHVLPDGTRIIFFGGQFRNNGEMLLGAQGNGQQWWWIPVEGGDPQPWSEPEGNYIAAYETRTRRVPGGGLIAYVGSAHGSACVSVQVVTVMDAVRPNSPPSYPSVPEVDETAERYAYIQGLAWSPAGDRLVFGVQPYNCPDAGSAPGLETPMVYIWAPQASSPGETGTPRKLAEGTYPVWVK